MNVLPDSGRFNGNDNNNVFSGITYAAPTYLSAVSGGSITSYAQFIHNNNDYGGSSGALQPEVKALIDKIRDANNRRYGPEWYVLLVRLRHKPSGDPAYARNSSKIGHRRASRKTHHCWLSETCDAVVLVTQTTGTLPEAINIGGQMYGLPFTNTFTALPKKYTAGFYVKVVSGSVAIAITAAGKGRAHIDGVLYPGGSAPVVLGNADGWKYVNLQSGPNLAGYNYRAFDVIASAGAQFYLAMPRFVFGHVEIDPNLGVLMNGKMFG